jgi:GNAT superfamily N-acetyltransferase
MNGIVFRQGRSGDGQALFDVTCASAKALQAGFYLPSQLEIWMDQRPVSWHENLLANGIVVVAEKGAGIVGFVHTIPGEVNRLFVLPEKAGRGLGKQLLSIGVENARLGHLGPIRLASSLNAVPFYERFGFKVVERGYFPPDVADGRAELIKMEL